MLKALWLLAQYFTFSELGRIGGPICAVLVLTSLWAMSFIAAFVLIRACMLGIFLVRNRGLNDCEMRITLILYFVVEIVLWAFYISFVFMAAGGWATFAAIILSVGLSRKLLEWSDVNMSDDDV